MGQVTLTLSEYAVLELVGVGVGGAWTGAVVFAGDGGSRSRPRAVARSAARWERKKGAALSVGPVLAKRLMTTDDVCARYARWCSPRTEAAHSNSVHVAARIARLTGRSAGRRRQCGVRRDGSGRRALSRSRDLQRWSHRAAVVPAVLLKFALTKLEQDESSRWRCFHQWAQPNSRSRGLGAEVVIGGQRTAREC